MKYLVALDQGTTSSRAVIFTEKGEYVSSAGFEFPQHYPHPGWVEHDPEEILSSQVKALQTAVQKAGIAPEDIASIGITNQRETTLLWDRKTGKCPCNAIVWQCRRTAPMVEKLVHEGCGEMIRQKTGLVADAYFSGTKLAWLLNEYGLREQAEKGELCFGTVDSFLCFRLISSHPHVTDATNAGRTMLFNLHTQDWDEDLLKLLDIPRACLPRVVDSAGIIGTLDESILGYPVPVAAIAGDQHAALFGQGCLKKGDVKNTYGTGCFMLMNLGEEFKSSQNSLLTTMAWRLNGKPTYALEGSVFIGGAVVQWLRDELHLISSAAETEKIALSVPDTNGVSLVPAFTGLGAPYWDMYARGTLVGLTRGASRAHIVRAALESIAFQSCDLLDAMAKDCGSLPAAMRVDGGASANGFLMQFQADIMNTPILRPGVLETTALGAALLGGLGAGVFSCPEDTLASAAGQTRFMPNMPSEKRNELKNQWHRAVDCAMYYGKDAHANER